MTALTQIQRADVDRIRQNLTNYTVGKKASPVPDKFWPEWTGVLSVNVEELLYIIDQISPPSLASCGHPANEDGECDCSSWPERAPMPDADHSSDGSFRYPVNHGPDRRPHDDSPEYDPDGEAERIGETTRPPTTTPAPMWPEVDPQ